MDRPAVSSEWAPHRLSDTDCQKRLMNGHEPSERLDIRMRWLFK